MVANAQSGLVKIKKVTEDSKLTFLGTTEFHPDRGSLSDSEGFQRMEMTFSQREFEALHEKIRQAPVTSKQARDYLRVFLSGASAEVPDKQNRVTIPSALRSYAGLDRDLVVIGAGSRAEIWDAQAWETYLAEQEAAFANTEEEVIPGLF